MNLAVDFAVDLFSCDFSLEKIHGKIHARIHNRFSAIFLSTVPRNPRPEIHGLEIHEPKIHWPEIHGPEIHKLKILASRGQALRAVEQCFNPYFSPVPAWAQSLGPGRPCKSALQWHTHGPTSILDGPSTGQVSVLVAALASAMCLTLALPPALSSKT